MTRTYTVRDPDGPPLVLSGDAGRYRAYLGFVSKETRVGTVVAYNDPRRWEAIDCDRHRVGVWPTMRQAAETLLAGDYGLVEGDR